MSTRKPLGEMTTEEFERYLKKRKLTGLAAIDLGQKRRTAIRRQGWDPDKERPIASQGQIPEQQTVEKTGENAICGDIHDRLIDSIGPKTWKQALPILELTIINGTPKGREMAIEEVRKMAFLADKLPEALALLTECRQCAPRLVGLSEYDGQHSVVTDPLTVKVDSFLKQFNRP